MSTRAAGPAIGLNTGVGYLKGVGPYRADLLRKLGIVVARDLLFHVPHRYEDASTIAPIASAEPGMDVTVLGTVISKGVIPTRKGLRIFQAVIRDDSAMIEVSWPGQPYLDRVIKKDDKLLLTGAVRFFHGRQLQPREMVNLGPDAEGITEGRVLSVYPATEGLSFKVIRSLIDAHIDALLPLVTEYLPAATLTRAGVPPLPEALALVHRPRSIADAHLGMSRLAFEELFFVHILHRRARDLARETREGIAFTNKRDLTSRLKAVLPYELTNAQVHVTREIVKDMVSDRRMHRLLQGDVGSGKTIVALFAMLLAIENGYQAALMAPTELLAEQHARTFEKLLAPLGVPVLLVTGSLPATERRAAAARMESGEPMVVVGTHALVQGDTKFAKLGLAVIDEQHRFGVVQRASLRQKGVNPDVLVMTATPIPRTLAMTVYGDLDISIIDECPPGRKEIRTKVFFEEERNRVYEIMRTELGKGNQVFVVYPLVEESENLDLRDATKMADHLQKEIFPDHRVGLIHGRMKGKDKDETMAGFLNRDINILVSTTVIEVGIDIPHASLIVIEHAERFGLSQLHQLRGRVGRSDIPSFCILMSHRRGSDDSIRRLRVMEETNDGFKIAEEDLAIRGPGEFMGTRQSGVPDFRIAHILRDAHILAEARSDAFAFAKNISDMDNGTYALLKKVLLHRWGGRFELAKTG